MIERSSKTLAIVPARGGSRAIPLKNIKPLAGRPLMAYTLLCANECRSTLRVVVSTDHDGIASVARDYRAEVVIRPPELASDTAPTEGALLHVLDTLKQNEGYEPELVLTLEPTSPFRSPALIDRCVALFKDSDADSALGVVETRSNYGRVNHGRFEFLFPGQPRRRQDRQPLYQECSTIYATRPSVLKTRKSVLGAQLYAVIVPTEEAVDINEPFDFTIAEMMISLRSSSKERSL